MSGRRVNFKDRHMITLTNIEPTFSAFKEYTANNRECHKNNHYQSVLYEIRQIVEENCFIYLNLYTQGIGDLWLMVNHNMALQYDLMKYVKSMNKLTKNKEYLFHSKSKFSKDVLQQSILLKGLVPFEGVEFKNRKLYVFCGLCVSK